MMKKDDKEIKPFPNLIINKFSLKFLFDFCVKSLEYYEFIVDPISKCLFDFKQIKDILDTKETKNIIFFFFCEKLSKIFFSMQMKSFH